MRRRSAHPDLHPTRVIGAASAKTQSASMGGEIANALKEPALAPSNAMRRTGVGIRPLLVPILLIIAAPLASTVRRKSERLEPVPHEDAAPRHAAPEYAASARAQA